MTLASSLCTGFFHPRIDPTLENSIEIEIGPVPKVLDLFTTKDGTINPILGKYQLEGDLKYRLNLLAQRLNLPIRKIPWEALGLNEKIQLIEFRQQESRQNYFANRRVPGLIYKKKINLHFEKEVFFQGRNFSPGTYTFSSEEIFSDKIEFMSARRMRKNLGFELHRRSLGRAGDNYQFSYIIQQGLGINKPPNMHSHIVAKMPKLIEEQFHFFDSDFQNRKAILIYKIILHYKAFSYYLMNQALKGGMQIVPKTEGIEVFMSVLNSIDLRKIYQYLKTPFWTQFFRNGSLVAFRDHKSYDGPQKYLGYEVRYLSPLFSVDSKSDMLNKIQEGLQNLLNQEPDLSNTEELNQAQLLQQIFESNSIEAIYHEVLNPLDFSFLDNLRISSFPDTEARTTDSLSVNDIHEVSKIYQDSHDKSLEIFLLHDWRKDPLTKGESALLIQIQNQQIFALKSLLYLYRKNRLGYREQIEIVSLFIRKSGLGFFLNKFLGLNDLEIMTSPAKK